MSGDFGPAGFDANAVEPNKPPAPMPKGEYPMMFIKKEKRASKKDPNNSYLWLEAQVLSGECQNRKCQLMLNLWHSSQTAKEIAQGDLSAICRAIGVMNPADSSELLNKPFIGCLKVDGDFNAFTGFKPRLNGPGPGPMPLPQPGTPGNPPAGAVGAPWGSQA